MIGPVYFTGRVHFVFRVRVFPKVEQINWIKLSKDEMRKRVNSKMLPGLCWGSLIPC